MFHVPYQLPKASKQGLRCAQRDRPAPSVMPRSLASGMVSPASVHRFCSVCRFQAHSDTTHMRPVLPYLHLSQAPVQTPRKLLVLQTVLPAVLSGQLGLPAEQVRPVGFWPSVSVPVFAASALLLRSSGGPYGSPNIIWCRWAGWRRSRVHGCRRRTWWRRQDIVVSNGRGRSKESERQRTQRE